MLCFYKHNFGSHHFDQTENKTVLSGFFFHKIHLILKYSMNADFGGQLEPLFTPASAGCLENTWLVNQSKLILQVS